MKRRQPPVLRPTATPQRGPLSRMVPVLALVGLALLGFYVVPAVAEHARLEREHVELQQRAHDAQSLLQQKRRELRAARRGTTSDKRARMKLQSEGARYLESRGR